LNRRAGVGEIESAFQKVKLTTEAPRNDEVGTRNAESKTIAFQFIIHRSAFIASLLSVPLWLALNDS
jgi:hypothetical protein